MNKSILIVDDEAINLDLTKSVLAPVGYDLFFARNGQECFAVLEDISRLPPHERG